MKYSTAIQLLINVTIPLPVVYYYSKSCPVNTFTYLFILSHIPTLCHPFSWKQPSGSSCICHVIVSSTALPLGHHISFEYNVPYLPHSVSDMVGYDKRERERDHKTFLCH